MNFTIIQIDGLSIKMINFEHIKNNIRKEYNTFYLLKRGKK